MSCVIFSWIICKLSKGGKLSILPIFANWPLLFPSPFARWAVVMERFFGGEIIFRCGVIALLISPGFEFFRYSSNERKRESERAKAWVSTNRFAGICVDIVENLITVSQNEACLTCPGGSRSDFLALGIDFNWSRTALYLCQHTEVGVLSSSLSISPKKTLPLTWSCGQEEKEEEGKSESERSVSYRTRLVREIIHSLLAFAIDWQ